MSIKEHRIYKFMDEPIRILGLTPDELLIVVAVIISLLVLSSWIMKLGILIGGIVTLFSLKKFKKVKAGFSFKSYMHWRFGIRAEIPKEWPKSWIRRWRS
jgi:type IV conjugative transfer system protein TraL